ncbi:phosphonate metabolism protein PhnP [Aquisalimonas lutea]|uniref:phosphonate metabolism protein PhnP n=1 Tax=Aquisalimonas lutea TaxID=1327750 RepID=UPI0025B390BF|nr:phosphonate metabolism protein PhnP [Aquisalimonas lutea]MDN3516418.1 phosphonate metabolism protein PhnP [Aquisalimonas lutea]
MRLTFLGTGAVDAAPLRGCGCAACERARRAPERGRAPASARVDAPGVSLMLDAGRTDFGALLDAAPADALLLTHFHVDHVQGLFPFRWGLSPLLPVHAPDDPEGCADLLRNHGCLRFSTLEPFGRLAFGDLAVTAVPLCHSRPTLGYVFDHGGKRLAYLTDTLGLPEETRRFLAQRPPDAMVLDCTHAPGAGRGNHNDPDDARAAHTAVKPGRTLLTHVSHGLDDWLRAGAGALPPGMEVVADGGVLDLD